MVGVAGLEVEVSEFGEGVVDRAEADEVVEVGGAAEGPAGDVVGLGVAGVDVASGDGAALVAEA